MTSHRVTREALAHFAAALGECGDDAVAPPTFAVTLTLPAAMAAAGELGIDQARVLHREQRSHHHRPIRAGDELTVELTVLERKSLRGNDVLVTREEVRTVTGEPVCTTTTTLVSR